MKIQEITKILIIATTFFVVGYDVFAYVFSGYDATVSKVMLSAIDNNPEIAFFAGVVCGHIFWAQTIEKRIQ